MKKTLASLQMTPQSKQDVKQLEAERQKIYNSLSPEEKQKFDALLKPPKEL